MTEKNVYVFSSRWGGNNKSYWKHCIENNVVFINNEHDSVTNFPEIARGVKKGDIIALRDGQKMYAVGIANNDAQVKNVLSGKPLFDSNDEIKSYGIENHVNAVYVTVYKWYTLTGEDKNNFNLQGLQDRVILIHEEKYNNTRKHIMEIYKSQLEGSMNNNEFKNNIESLLTNNYNLILTGAPGTGKTYIAKQIAAKMIFGEDISLDEIEKDENKKNKFELQYKFVQFHPSYDYTDFVEGIRPATKNDDTYGFKRKDGTFKDFCIKALKNYKSIISENDVREFCEYIKTEIKAMGKFSIKGIGGDNVSPICKIDINDNDVRVEVNTVNHHCFTKTYLELLKLYDNYKDYINSNNQTYQEFVQTYNMPNGQHTYMHGFLHAMYKYFNKSFVFVIDEINRGDINKILGELFYAIDLGYRGEKGKVKTQYQNLVESGDVFENGFYIPENVYIIGTMNDIDRSVESMDFAIRRRFAWYEINPNKTSEEILKNLEIDNYVSKPDEKSYKILEKLNECISGKDENGKVIDKDALGEMYQIGASYFLRLDKYFNKENENKNESIKNAYQKLWDNHLKGLIYEYVRGKKSGSEIFDKIKNKYDELIKKINTENHSNATK